MPTSITKIINYENGRDISDEGKFQRQHNIANDTNGGSASDHDFWGKMIHVIQMIQTHFGSFLRSNCNLLYGLVFREKS